MAEWLKATVLKTVMWETASWVRIPPLPLSFLRLTNWIFSTIIVFMKKDIHPTYFPQAKVVCSCGNTFTVGATKPELKVEICAQCHPFYTGEEKLIDTAGRVEKFKTRRAAAATTPKVKKVRAKKQ